MMNGPDDFVGPVNLGNPGEFSVLTLAEMVIKSTHSQSKIVFKPLPRDDPRQRQPDISLAKQKLDWQPRVDLQGGLMKTIEYFRKTL
jgi:UDP-glucuronate decarboxylase